MSLRMSAAGPSQGANRSPSGGSAAAIAASVGGHTVLPFLALFSAGVVALQLCPALPPQPLVLAIGGGFACAVIVQRRFASSWNRRSNTANTIIPAAPLLLAVCLLGFGEDFSA